MQRLTRPPSSPTGWSLLGSMETCHGENLPCHPGRANELRVQCTSRCHRDAGRSLLYYYFLIDGRGLIDRAVGLMPRREVMTRFLKELDAIYSSFFRLLFVTAAIIAAIGAIGYLLLGVTSRPPGSNYGCHIPGSNGRSGCTLRAHCRIIPLSSRTMSRPLRPSSLGLYFSRCCRETSFSRARCLGASIHPLVTLLAFTAPLLVPGILVMIKACRSLRLRARMLQDVDLLQGDEIRRWCVRRPGYAVKLSALRFPGIDLILPETLFLAWT